MLVNFVKFFYLSNFCTCRFIEPFIFGSEFRKLLPNLNNTLTSQLSLKNFENQL